MAALEDHIKLADQLYADMLSAKKSGSWPIVVDAGFYSIFHGMEAVNAIECRDTYSFADAADIIETILVERGLNRGFLSHYRYIFYFRRGVIYGGHFPTETQMTEFSRRVDLGFGQIKSALRQQAP